MMEGQSENKEHCPARPGQRAWPGPFSPTPACPCEIRTKKHISAIAFYTRTRRKQGSITNTSRSTNNWRAELENALFRPGFIASRDEAAGESDKLGLHSLRLDIGSVRIGMRAELGHKEHPMSESAAWGHDCECHSLRSMAASRSIFKMSAISCSIFSRF